MPKTITGIAAPLPQANIDTDVIMPKRFLKTVTRDGLADGALADLRFDSGGAERPDFVLNKAPWRDARILVVGDNFGCGSSREHAVWGLKQLGVDCIIGTGFAGIFYDNARKNLLALPIVAPTDRDELLKLAQQPDGPAFEIDLPGRVIEAVGRRFNFAMDDATRATLIEEFDEVADTLSHATRIRAFENAHLPHNRIAVRGKLDKKIAKR